MTHNFKLSLSSYKHSLSSYELSLSTYRLRLSLKFSPVQKRINTSVAKGFQRFFCNYFAGKQKKAYLCSRKSKDMRPDGGIGRRAGLKHQWGNPSRFDPGSGYAKRLLIK